ncbi:hypothetical protein HYFRA_00013824 [Hymenoscyphus fraxineus]|uniref:Amidoligase enzyme n=1 Tax=Hymenoscyphus fraxineus TaxID=746836 RepID=A0A9N9LBB0_9HELO|nr:hypothetical protein HYFRA_00013824 [Hymenoscyphus fraxineus]
MVYNLTSQMLQMNKQAEHIKRASKVSNKALTFGVELEFMIAGLDKEFKDPTPKDPRNVRGKLGSSNPGSGTDENQEIYEEIAKILLDNGVDAEARDFFNNMWTLTSQKSWAVDTDTSIVAPNIRGEDDPNSNYHFHRVEICSPILLFTEMSLAAVAEVCGILSSNFRIHLNASCGLHVHIGNGMDGFAVETLRNLMATVFTFEPTIDKIHPANRRNYPRICPMAPGLRFCSRLRQMQPPEVDSLSEYCDRGLDALFGAQSIRDLFELVCYQDRNAAITNRMAYNIINLLENEPGKPRIVIGGGEGLIGVKNSKKTIEFRQHAGSISPEQVTNWISFCAFLVQFSQSVDETLLRPFLQSHAKSTDLSMGKICEALGMWEVSRYFGNLPQFGEDWDEWEEVVEAATAPSAENAPRKRGALGKLLSARVTRVLPSSKVSCLTSVSRISTSKIPTSYTERGVENFPSLLTEDRRTMY